MALSGLSFSAVFIDHFLPTIWPTATYILEGEVGLWSQLGLKQPNKEITCQFLRTMLPISNHTLEREDVL